MISIESVANVVSIIGTCFGLFSRVPQVYKTYKTKSAGDLSTQTMMINITANSCFLFYTIVHKQYPIMFNCLSVITLESSLVYMKRKFGNMKKSSSQTNLIDMDLSHMVSDEEA
jgi:MtN3 and saliva related transmembrane protein